MENTRYIVSEIEQTELGDFSSLEDASCFVKELEASETQANNKVWYVITEKGTTSRQGDCDALQSGGDVDRSAARRGRA